MHNAPEHCAFSFLYIATERREANYVIASGVLQSKNYELCIMNYALCITERCGSGGYGTR